MSSSREAPRLDKDIWLYKILPLLDKQSLLNFGAASKQARHAAYCELFKRSEFAKNIERKFELSKRGTPSRSAYMDWRWRDNEEEEGTVLLKSFGNFAFYLGTISLFISLVVHLFPPDNKHINNPYGYHDKSPISWLEVGLYLTIFGLFTDYLLTHFADPSANEDYDRWVQSNERNSDMARRVTNYRDKPFAITDTSHSLFSRHLSSNSDDHEKPFQHFAAP